MLGEENYICLLVSPKAMGYGNVGIYAIYLPSQRKKLNPKIIKYKMTQQVIRRVRYNVVPSFMDLYLLLGKSK